MLGLIRNLLASKAHNQFDKLLRNSRSAAVRTTSQYMGSIVVRADFGSGLIWPRAQTCMDSNVVRVDFGSGLICPRAQTCCASPTRTPARLANSPGFKSFHCPRWRIKFSLERFQIPSRICLRPQPLESSLGRVPQAAD